MALQLDYIGEDGLSAAGSYWRIDEVVTVHNDKGDYHQILLKGYASQEWYAEGKVNFAQKWILKDYSPESTASFSDLYSYVKTQPEFEGAVDC